MTTVCDSARLPGWRSVAIAVLGSVLALAATVEAQTPLRTVRVASGLSRAVGVMAPPGDFDRLFILEQRAVDMGRVRILNLRTNTMQATPFLTVGPVPTGQFASEQGLLGLAFHPNYLQNGYFWVHYNDSAGRTVLERYRALGDPATATTADVNSATLVLRLTQPFSNHNGGWIEFGPDGYLYMALGDGGSANDPGNRSQNTGLLLGKMLRIDVDGPDNIPGNADDDCFPADTLKHYCIPPDNPFVGGGGAPEVWAYGLRNHWRNDFDPVTGDLFIPDVGQDFWEEINFQPAHAIGTMPGQPGYMGGRNYGWRCMEGLVCTGLSGCTCNSPALVNPFLVYGHNQLVAPTFATGCSITGGIVYRGCAVPDLQGTYFFADLCSNRIFSMRYDGSAITNFQERTAQFAPGGGLSITNITSFGRDAWGEMYICTLNGQVFKVIPNVPGWDVNGDNVADLCRCPADWDGNGQVNSVDISLFISVWLEAVQQGTNTADYNGDGSTNSADISAFITSWLAALQGGC